MAGLGKGALIMNPPSAWAVAKRDAPQVAEQCWTHGFRRPEGTLRALFALFLEHLELLQEQGSGKSLLIHLSKPDSIEKLVVASGGYDLPAYEKLTTLKVCRRKGRPRATLYHYPNPFQSPDAIDRGFARAAEDRAANLLPGHADQDVPEIPPG